MITTEPLFSNMRNANHVFVAGDIQTRAIMAKAKRHSKIMREYRKSSEVTVFRNFDGELHIVDNVKV